MNRIRNAYSLDISRLRERQMQHTENQVRETMQEALQPPFMRLPMVMRWTGLGRSTIYRLVAAHQFPRR